MIAPAYGWDACLITMLRCSSAVRHRPPADRLPGLLLPVRAPVPLRFPTSSALMVWMVASCGRSPLRDRSLIRSDSLKIRGVASPLSVLPLDQFKQSRCSPPSPTDPPSVPPISGRSCLSSLWMTATTVWHRMGCAPLTSTPPWGCLMRHALDSQCSLR